MPFIWQKGLDMMELSPRIYRNKGAFVSYPFVVTGTDATQVNMWNRIIIEDIDKILGLYSFDSLPQTKEEPDLFMQSTLYIRYYIKRNDDRFLSIFYTADFYNPYAAYPTQAVFTTNIDLVNNRRLYLLEIIGKDIDLSRDITSWELITHDMSGQEYSKIVKDYILGLGEEARRRGFLTADIIGPGNYLGIFSYITPSRIGISISVPNYIGDHAEFEKDIDKI